MKRVLCVVALAVAAVVLTPISSHAVSPADCAVVKISESPGQTLVFAKGGPFVHQGATTVATTCELRHGESIGPVVGTITRQTPGSVAVMATDQILYNLPRGNLYVCTYSSIVFPSPARFFHGCAFSFAN